MVADGKAQFIDWEEAKKQIKEATNKNDASFKF
jgi:hypothetical protein